MKFTKCIQKSEFLLELTVKLDVTAHAFSKSAVAKIEAQQGTTSIL